MSNMSYCRFQNTAGDLRECLEEMGQTRDLSPDEQRARLSIIKMCVEIALDYGDEVGSPVEESDE